MSSDSAAGGNSPHLSEDEREQAADHSTPHALVIHEVVREDGEAALRRPAAALAWSGLAAGLSMGFSFLVQAVLSAGLPETEWRHLVAGLGYCTGFVIVILGRQQLFTESTLTVVLPVLMHRNAATLASALRLWAVVLAANVAGTFAFAALLTVPDVFQPSVVKALDTLSLEPMAHGFWSTTLRAVFAGWLIALMVWLLPSARSARLLTVLLISYVVAVSRLSHIIAGSVEAAYAVLAHHAPVRDFLLRFFAPTLLGNIIGGVSLVAMVNHASVASEIEHRG
ncbi:formate/nitrite transporter family protein [Bordetella genomosp. 9]|uniref:Transporter n=1 Tax=Bordetella genomosp. 9 TaxID=1416803 RepID=A0A1W6YWC8_9BORD|nr:formate/nitrite transporter family protein [Bordetella genomosp. 9]ARP85407.1 transporter [Bordetella genomosp. 9]ARP92465.1 transporter [Bordetella genomosp. 9]